MIRDVEEPAPGPRPLAGVRVLDLTRVLAGPLGTMVLADLGADVVKVERPDGGDDLRHWGPPFTPDGESVYFLAVNRNKRSIALDLRSGEGRALFLELAAGGCVIENFRTGTLDELGIGWEILHAANPRLVLVLADRVRLSGPYRDLPGYDIVVQAMGGIMSVTGEPEGRPMRVGIAIVDVLAGLYAAIAVQAALRERDRTGTGDRVELSLLEVELASMVNVVHNQLIAGLEPKPVRQRPPEHGPLRRLSDGGRLAAIAVATEDQWRRLLCGARTARNWLTDARFATNPQRSRNREALSAIIEPVLARRHGGHGSNGCARPTSRAGRSIRSASCLPIPRWPPSSLLRTIERASGPIEVVGSPLRFDSGALPAAAPPPSAHDTDAVLGEAGIDAERIRSLRERGVIR